MLQKKNLLKRVQICLLSIMMLLSLVGCSIPLQEAPIPYVEVTVSDEIFADKFYYGVLAEEEKQIYKQVYQGIMNHQDEIYIHGVDWETAYLTISYIMKDFADIFWIDGAAECSTYGEEYMVLEPNYVYTLEERTQRETEIEAVVSTILSQIPEEYTDYEKIKFVYEYLVNTVDYMDDATDSQNIYSTFVNKQTVCAGYAKANQYLLNELDVFCMYVTGTSSETKEGEAGHAWNIVKADENYYIVDVTWADPVDEDDGDQTEEDMFVEPMVYEYLCCSQEAVEETHFKEEGFPYPECNSNELEYYRLNGRYYEAINDAEFQKTMKADIKAKAPYTQFKFANTDLANTAREMFLGDWMQDITNYYCELYNVETMSYYSELIEEYNRITIYWIYEE